MIPSTTLPTSDSIDHARIDEELDATFRDVLLEHARIGRSVCESRDGKVVWITPEEIFARYGLDANGKPLPRTSV
jgi:hypothetical protein